MIRVPNIRVIDEKGEQIGILPTRDAQNLARERGLDLIEISPTANPPVCKIGDFGKYKYEIAKKQKDAKKKQHVVHLKEIKMHPKTETNDYSYRIKHAREFLEDGDRVKITVAFKGREMAYLEFGRRLLDRAEQDITDIADCEVRTQLEGRNMFSTFIAKRNVVKKKKEEKERLQKQREPGETAAPAEPIPAGAVETPATGS